MRGERELPKNATRKDYFDGRAFLAAQDEQVIFERQAEDDRCSRRESTLDEFLAAFDIYVPPEQSEKDIERWMLGFGVRFAGGKVEYKPRTTDSTALVMCDAQSESSLARPSDAQCTVCATGPEPGPRRPRNGAQSPRALAQRAGRGRSATDGTSHVVRRVAARAVLP